jgi:hypothetical protein
MTPEEYLQVAEQYREALRRAENASTRYRLEAMERTYRTMADSERALPEL